MASGMRDTGLSFKCRWEALGVCRPGIHVVTPPSVCYACSGVGRRGGLLFYGVLLTSSPCAQVDQAPASPINMAHQVPGPATGPPQPTMPVRCANTAPVRFMSTRLPPTSPG